MTKLDQKNNFDHIRLILALGVFFFHIAVLTQKEEFAFFKTYFNASVAVHSFFIVSGFLIFMSYEKSTSLKNYLNKRFSRIVPGYVAVIILTFLLLGSVSTLSIMQYFLHPDSWKYLLANITTLNFLHLGLPEVFTTNQLQAVNGSLWTIKIEVAFYFTVPFIVYLFRWLKPNNVLILIFILSAAYYYLMGYLAVTKQLQYFYVLQRQLPGQMMFFSGGALLYYNLKHFKTYAHLYFIAGILCYLLLYSISFYLLYVLSLSIIVIYFAISFPYMGHISKYGDLSYGIYIWHFPIIQTFIALNLFERFPQSALMLLIGIVLFISWLSWHLVEKPYLNKKSHYITETKEK